MRHYGRRNASLSHAGVEDLAVKSGVSTEEAFGLLKHNYDGYHFMPGSPDIYNPFSVLRALNNRKIGAYWFQTATPSYLVRMLRHRSIELPSLQDGCFIRESEMTVSDPHLANPIALMYQTATLQSTDTTHSSKDTGCSSPTVRSRRVSLSIYSRFTSVRTGYR